MPFLTLNSMLLFHGLLILILIFYFKLNPATRYRYFNILLQVGITDDFDYLELAPIVPQGPVGDQMLEGNP